MRIRVKILALFRSGWRTSNSAVQVPFTATQEQSQAPNTLHHHPTDGTGKQVPWKAIPVHIRARRVLSIPEPDRDSGENMVSKQTSQREATERGCRGKDAYVNRSPDPHGLWPSKYSLISTVHRPGLSPAGPPRILDGRQPCRGSGQKSQLSSPFRLEQRRNSSRRWIVGQFLIRTSHPSISTSLCSVSSVITIRIAPPVCAEHGPFTGTTSVMWSAVIGSETLIASSWRAKRSP